MNNINYAHQIVNNLEKKGESKDFIIGFLSATIDGLRHLTNTKQIESYLKDSVKHSIATR